MEQKTARTILVLEDEKQLANAIREAFAGRGFDVVVAATVEEGVKSLENLKTVNVIWLDHYLLGSSNGLDFVVQIKNHPEWSNIPIFVVSNEASTTNIRSYMKLGVTNYYTKADYDINQIIKEIEYALENESN